MVTRPHWLLCWLALMLASPATAQVIQTDVGELRINKNVKTRFRIEPISFNKEQQIDSHGIRLFGNGRYALVADRRGNAVLSFDVSDPADMKLISRVSSRDTAGAHYVTVGPEEKYGYTGANGCFTVIDISDPAHISICGVSRPAPGFSQEIVIDKDNRYAYWALTGKHAVYAIDISDKAAPKAVGVISGIGAPNYLQSAAHLELHPEKDVLFVTSYRDHHLGSIDISDPANMTIIDSVNDHMISPHELVYDRGYLYIGVMYDNDAENPRETGALMVYDVSDPADLRFVTELKMGEGYPQNQYPFDMLHGLTLDRKRQLLYGGSQKNNGTQCRETNSALSVFDVSDPTKPVWLQSLQSCSWLDGAQQVDFRGDILFTCNHDVPSIASFRLAREDKEDSD